MKENFSFAEQKNADALYNPEGDGTISRDAAEQTRGENEIRQEVDSVRNLAILGDWESILAFAQKKISEGGDRKSFAAQAAMRQQADKRKQLFQ